MFCRQRLDAFEHLGGLFAELGGLVRPGIVIGQLVDAVLEFSPVMLGRES